MKNIKRDPLFSWVKYNLVGAAIGICCDILVGVFIAERILPLSKPNELYDYYLGPVLSGVFFWLPFALCLGILQRMKLKQWNIQTYGWILATALGWCILGITFTYANNFVLRENNLAPWQMFVIYAITLLSGGTFIGLFQALAARHSLSKPEIWILTNSLGIFSLVAISVVLIGMPLILKSDIIELLHALGLYALVEARDVLLLGFLIVSEPFLGTFTFFIPTGKVMLKYGIQSAKKDDRIHKINGESTSRKTG